MSLLEHAKKIAAELANPTVRMRAMTALEFDPPIIHQDVFGAMFCRKPTSIRVILSKARCSASASIKYPRTFSFPELRGKFMSLADVEAFNRRLWGAVEYSQAESDEAEAALKAAPPEPEPGTVVRVPRTKPGRPSKREAVEARALGITVPELRAKEVARNARTVDPITKKRKG